MCNVQATGWILKIRTFNDEIFLKYADGSKSAQIIIDYRRILHAHTARIACIVEIIGTISHRRALRHSLVPLTSLLAIRVIDGRKSANSIRIGADIQKVCFATSIFCHYKILKTIERELRYIP